MKIIIERAAIFDSEDLMDFVNKLHKSVVENASQFGGEPGNIYIIAAYRDSVVVRDMAKDRFIKAAYKRKSDREFVFTKFTIVRKAWEEVRTLENVDDVDRENDNVQNDAFEEIDVVIKRSKWSGIL